MLRRIFPLKAGVQVVETNIPPNLTQFETKCLVDCNEQVSINNDNNPNRTLAVWKMQTDTEGTAIINLSIQNGTAKIRVYDAPDGVLQNNDGLNVIFKSIEAVEGVFSFTVESNKPYLFVDFLEKTENVEIQAQILCYTNTSVSTNPAAYYSELLDTEVEIEQATTVDVRVLDNAVRNDLLIFSTLRVAEVEEGAAISKSTGGLIAITAPAWTGTPSVYDVHFAIEDIYGIEHCGTVIVTTTNASVVIEAPELVDDLAEVNENESIVIGVLDNDISKENFVLNSLRIVTQPALGIVTVNADGTITYFAPSVSSDTQDTFQYDVRDFTGTLLDAATVTVNIYNVPPAAQLVNDEYTFEYLMPISVQPTQNDILTGLDLSSIRLKFSTGAGTNARFENLTFKIDQVITTANDFLLFYEIDSLDGLTTYEAQMTFRRKGTSTQPTTLAPNIQLQNNFTGDVILNGGSLSFGNHEIGTSTFRSVTIKNIGTLALNVSSVVVSTGFSAQNFVGSLPPNSQQSFTIVMDANTAGSKTGTLTVNSNDPDTPNYVVNLNGGINQNLAPKLTVLDTITSTVKAKNSTQTFGNHAIGQTVTRQFTLKNEGNTVLNVSNVLANSDFTTSGFAGAIPTGGSVTVQVSMSTATGDTKTGVLSVISDDSNSPYTVNLSGTVPEAVIIANPDIQIIEIAQVSTIKNPYQTLQFGSQEVGATATRQIIIRNNGNAILTVSSLTLPTGFTASGFSSGAIPANTGVSVTLTLDTATEGIKEGLLLINSNDPDTPVFNLNLRGEVVAFSPNVIVRDDQTDQLIEHSGKVVFATTEQNNGISKGFNILNIGDANLNVSSIVVAGDFTKDSSLDVASISPNTQRFLAVSMNTNTAGNKIGTITINSNDPDTAAYIINLEGRVIALEPAISVQFIGDTAGFPLGATRQFGTYNVDDVVERILRVRNNGNADLTISSLTFTNAGFTITPSSYAGILAPNQGFDIVVAMNTSTVGAKTSQLLINSNDPNIASYELNFSGNVVTPVGPEIYVSRTEGGEVSNAIKDLSAKSLIVFPPSSQSSRVKQFFMRNIGTADLQIKGIAFQNTGLVFENSENEPPFGTNLNLQTIASGAIISFNVEFNPKIAGAYSANLNIITNDADDVTFRIRLSGETDFGFGGVVIDGTQSVPTL